MSAKETDDPNAMLVKPVFANALVGIVLTAEGSLRLVKFYKFENSVPIFEFGTPVLSRTSIFLMLAKYALFALLPNIALKDASPGKTKLYKDVQPTNVFASMLFAFGISIFCSFVLF